jgi:hypothetical protein
MIRRICLAFALLFGLVGATLTIAGMTAHSATACENHTS